jgi:hypothetical protein
LEGLLVYVSGVKHIITPEIEIVNIARKKAVRNQCFGAYPATKGCKYDGNL